MQNIHPMFVHFPIALLIFSVVCDILGRLFKKDSLENAGWWGLCLGILAIVLTATTGLLAASSVPHIEAAHELMENHEHLQLIAGAIFLILFIVRIVNKTRLPQRTIAFALYIVVALAGIGTMSFGAHLGGRLVYEFGVGTNIVKAEEHHAGHVHGKEVYKCPMHPDVTSDKPGKCPKCGMFLKLEEK